MTVINKSKPDVLRVTEYVLNQSKANEAFSVQSATNSDELNGIGRYQIARIIRDICLDPEDEGSLIRCTTVDDTNIDNTPCRWQLNANTYFSYLSYLSIEQSEKANKIAIKALYVAMFSTFIAFVSILVGSAA
jgi:hypothetical protein